MLSSKRKRTRQALRKSATRNSFTTACAKARTVSCAKVFCECVSKAVPGTSHGKDRVSPSGRPRSNPFSRIATEFRKEFPKEFTTGTTERDRGRGVVLVQKRRKIPVKAFFFLDAQRNSFCLSLSLSSGSSLQRDVLQKKYVNFFYWKYWKTRVKETAICCIAT